MAPIFTGSADVGVDVTEGVVVGLGVTAGVIVGLSVVAGVGVEEGVCSFALPQATNMGTTKTKAKAKTTILFCKLLFGYIINHLLLPVHC